MLASHLLDLGNHHAAMALVTSLKQGCITRLYFTLEKVEKKTKEIFLSMQVSSPYMSTVVLVYYMDCVI